MPSESTTGPSPVLTVTEGHSIWRCELVNGKRFCATTLDQARRVTRAELGLADNVIVDECVVFTPETAKAMQAVARGRLGAVRALPFSLSDIADLTGYEPQEIAEQFACRKNVEPPADQPARPTSNHDGSREFATAAVA